MMFSYRNVLPAMLAMLLLLSLSGCKQRQSSSALMTNRKMPSVVQVDGFKVPVFPSAEEQLNYTHSWFESLEEKKAALAAVARFFPKATEQNGAAALDLAYLVLGRDYRLATTEKCKEAIDHYQQIIKEFHEFPQICAKATWYIGWISCDLLGDCPKGLMMYRTVVNNYPDERLNLTPAVPWVTFITPQSSADKKDQTTANPLWADLARIEIIRHADDASTAQKAFFEIWNGDRNKQVEGIALKLLLQRNDLSQEIVPYAEAYLRQTTVDTALQNDIRSVLPRLHPQGGGSR